VRQRIFGTSKARIGLHLTDFSRFLVPALGCFLLVLGTLSTRMNERHAFPAGPTNGLLPYSGAQNGRLVLAQSVNHSGVNAVPAKRVEWSIGLARPTGIGAALISYTNKLIQ
jgi:hypothetical protein